MALARLTCLLTLCLWIGAARADTIHIAVASNFAEAMKVLTKEFEAASGHRVVSSYGSSGKFFAQIKHGAPFQAFFSADQIKPAALETEGLVVPGSRFTYAVGVLALWSSRSDRDEVNADRLERGNFNKLALANPRLAPFGAAAMEVLEYLELKEATRPKWVQGENVAQAFQFVSTGNADLGFVSLSQIMRDGKFRRGSGWIVPGEMHRPILQDAVLLVRGADSSATRALLDFVRSEHAREIVTSYGYTMPSPPKGAAPSAP